MTDDDLDLATLPDDELVEQMHDDLYDGMAEEIDQGTRILLDRGWSPQRTLNESLVVTRAVPTWGWLALGGTVLVGAGIAMERAETGPVESGRRLVDVVSERYH